MLQRTKHHQMNISCSIWLQTDPWILRRRILNNFATSPVLNKVWW